MVRLQVFSTHGLTCIIETEDFCYFQFQREMFQIFFRIPLEFWFSKWKYPHLWDQEKKIGLTVLEIWNGFFLVWFFYLKYLIKSIKNIKRNSTGYYSKGVSYNLTAKGEKRFNILPLAAFPLPAPPDFGVWEKKKIRFFLGGGGGESKVNSLQLLNLDNPN